MRSGSKNRGGIGLLLAALIGFAGLPALAQAPAGGTSVEWIKKLGGLATEPELDLAELKKRAAERIKARVEPIPNKRPPMAPELNKLPHLVAEILFDEDAAVVRPDSYRTLGRIADTLTHPSMLGYKFLIVGHTASGGRRDFNLTLSQRRADVIRDVLVNTFKVSSKRLVTLGLGEEQLLDRAKPGSPVNQQTQIATIGSSIEANSPPVAPAAAVPAKAGTHKPKR
ncbi:OmpA family protein [Bradyrhizobium sediminis]|uniref:OmpA family protein n=1 Tax=Bradyrhizobium sediminis TaxID=2840469 RepID=A0A975P168_9BRAD|nr:OmpA family protein [Bradyrhizobium sediminis]QWG24730.1 OmpA family protein [Bradyrhizobium sediminis]